LPYVAPEDANNKLVDSLDEVKARNGNPPWRETELATERFRMIVLCWPPGFVYPKVRVAFDNGAATVAGPGSVLFAEKGTVHEMAAIGEEPLVMIAVVIPNEPDDDVFME